MNDGGRRAMFGKLLSLKVPARVRLLWGRIYRASRMGLWFPHVPLALAVGLAGFAELLPSLGSLHALITSVSMAPQDINGLSRRFDALAIHGASQEVIGGLLVLLSFGLLLRSRLVWVLTLLTIAVLLVLQFLLHAPTDMVVVAYDTGLLVMLFWARDDFQRASLTTGTLFALVGVLLTMGYGVLGSYALGPGFSPAITDFSSALYFTVVTMSTVGYGDITPHSANARLFTMSLIVLGLVMFATSLTAIVGPLINHRMMNLLQPRKKPMKRKDHIIVVGDNALARNAIRALSDRGVHVTAIWSARPPEGVEEPEDLVIGDGSDGEVLKNAGIGEARAVLALSENDSDNAFVTLAAKDANENVRTVVAVSDAHNMGRVRHVRPDAVLALPVIGGELLAMALSGEEINTDALLEQLLRLSP